MIKEGDIVTTVNATINADTNAINENEYPVFGKLKTLQTMFKMDNITSDMIILYDQKNQRFYNPEKTNILYQYVSYSTLFSTNTIKSDLNLLLGFFKQTPEGAEFCYESPIIVDLKKFADTFSQSIQEKQHIDMYISELKTTLECINTANRVFEKASNKNEFSDEWNRFYDPMRRLLKDAESNASTMYYYDKKTNDVVTLLVEAHGKLKELKQDRFSYDNVFSTAFWRLHEDDALNILNNEKHILKRLCKLMVSAKNKAMMDFYTNTSMMFYDISWTIYYAYRFHVDSGNKENLTKFIKFCDKIKDKKLLEHVTKCDNYRYVLILLDSEKRQKLIRDIKTLSDVNLIKNISTISRVASSFKDDILQKACNSIYKRRNRGDLDKNDNPREIMSIHFKDLEKIKQDPDFLHLTSNQREHLDNYLISGISKEPTTFYRDDQRVLELGTVPKLIFKLFQKNTSSSFGKISGGKDFKGRCRNHAFARAVIKYYGFDKLIAPRFGFISTDRYDIIYEEKINIISSQDVQEEYYTKYASRMRDTIKQLTQFCCLVGLDDIAWRNIPLDNKSLLDTNADVKIVLVDFGEVESYNNSIFGGAFNRIGLIRCVDSSLFDIVKAVYIDMVVKPNEINMHGYRFDNCIKIRLEEIKNQQDMNAYFESKNITKQTRYQHVSYDENLIKFDEYDEADQKMLYDVAKHVVESINLHFDKLAANTNTDKQLLEPIKCTRTISLENVCLQYDVHKETSGHKYYYQSVTPNYCIDICQYIYTKNDKEARQNDPNYSCEKMNTYVDVVFNELLRVGAIFKIRSCMNTVIV